MFLVSLRFLSTIHVKWFSMGCLNYIIYIIQKDGKMDATEEIDDKRALDFFSRAMSESRRYVCFSIFVHKYLIYTKNIGI